MKVIVATVTDGLKSHFHAVRLVFKSPQLLLRSPRSCPFQCNQACLNLVSSLPLLRLTHRASCKYSLCKSLFQIQVHLMMGKY